MWPKTGKAFKNVQNFVSLHLTNPEGHRPMKKLQVGRWRSGLFHLTIILAAQIDFVWALKSALM
jgi:hypothetical protein